MFSKLSLPRSAAALALLLAATHLHAQQPDQRSGRTEYEAYLGIGMRSLGAGFAANHDGTLTESTDCGQFTNGWGRTLLAGIGARWQIGPALQLGAVLEARTTSSSLQYNCVDPASIRLPDGSIVPATTRHVADLQSLDLALRPQLSWRPFADVPLSLDAGPELWWIAAATTFEIREEIVEPAAAEFLTGGQVQHYAKGDGEDAGRFVPAFAIGARYTAPLAREWSWRIGVGSSVGLGTISPRLDLGASQFALTLGIAHTPESTPEPIPVVARADSAPPTLPLPAYRLEISAVDENGVRSGTATVVEDRELNTRLHPLLPYLFFDSASAVLPTRYQLRTPEGSSSFTHTQLRDSSTLGIYHNLLDIIGERMRNNPAARLTITACQPDRSRSGGQLTLAEMRAELVRTYLSSNWGIAANRLRTQLRQAPVTQSNEDTPEGAQENRRVELSSDVAAVTAPILFTDTVVERTVPKIEVRLAGDRPATSWQLQLGEQAMGEQRGTATTLDRSEELIVPAIGNAVQANAQVRVDGIAEPIDAAPATLPVRRTDNGTRLHYGEGTYSLILFDFNSAALRAEHQSILRLVEERCDSTTRASIYGTTDMLGMESHNLELSRARAEGVSRGLRGVAIERVVGQGERTDLYDNALPEGRFYSRSVTIQTRHAAGPAQAPPAPRGTP